MQIGLFVVKCLFFRWSSLKWKCPSCRHMPLRLNYDLNNLPLGTVCGVNKTRSKTKAGRFTTNINNR